MTPGRCAEPEVASEAGGDGDSIYGTQALTCGSYCCVWWVCRTKLWDISWCQKCPVAWVRKQNWWHSYPPIPFCRSKECFVSIFVGHKSQALTHKRGTTGLPRGLLGDPSAFRCPRRKGLQVPGCFQRSFDHGPFPPRWESRTQWRTSGTASPRCPCACRGARGSAQEAPVADEGAACLPAGGCCPLAANRS